MSHNRVFRPITKCLLNFCSLAALYTCIASTPYAQEIKNLVRGDQASTPAAIYAVEHCKGIAIISHGAGGSEKGYAYLAKALQNDAWYTIVPGHQESGMPSLRQHMKGKGIKAGLGDLVTDANAYSARFLDIQAALQYAQSQCQTETRILLGHSMGAATTFLLAGAKNTLRLTPLSLPFDGYVAMSPQGVGSIFPAHAWSDIHAPVLTMTGTRDTELGGQSWEVRLDPFRDMKPPCKWSAVIDGASHMSFAGHGGVIGGAKEKQLILSTALHFMNQIKQRQCILPPPQTGMMLESK